MLEKGTKVAGYEIEGILGHGGMGVVYEARQLSLGRTVALKILAGTLGMDPSFKERFRSEGRIQATLDHPHIVTIFEAGEWDDSLFIAMRLVRGPNLKEMIIARELEGARTLRILRPIAEALDSAHEAGLIHRDIKPQNILVGSRDRAYLADFGLTKGIDDAGLTQTGQFVGTIDYIAPEQIRGEQATGACDIYALSAVLYECLTGTVPYPKPSDAAVMYAHLSEPPPLVTDQRPELPPNLDEVICKAMDKDPKGRYQTASALIDEAERALGKRVRAVITPPGPIEGPEEAGIREKESRVPTRPERVRKPPEPRPETAVPVPAAPTAAGATAAGATAAPIARPADPTLASAAIPAPADPTVASPAVRPEESNPIPAPAHPTVASAAVRPEESAPLSPPTVAMPAAERGASARRRQASRAESSATIADEIPAEPDTRRTTTSSFPWAIAAVVLVVAAVAGYLLGKPGDDPKPAATDTGLTSSTTAGALDLRFPGSWERRGEAPKIPGLTLRDQVALGPADQQGEGVIAGMSDGKGATLLPAAFLSSLAKPPRAPDHVRLGKVEALRYEGLEPNGFGGRSLTVFAVPTSAGVATIACFAPPGGGAAFRGDCDRVAGSLAVRDADTYPVGADPAYAAGVSRVLDGLAKRRKAGRAALASAGTRAGQSQAAASLADTYALAKADLGGLETSPVNAQATAALGKSLQATAAAYKRLAAAKSRPAFLRASAAVRRAEGRVNTRVAALKALGYQVS